MTLRPLFALALGGLDALHVSGTFRTVFSPVGAGGEQRPADGAPFGVQTVEQGCFQFLVQRQHRRPEPATQQGVRNGLDTDAFLAVIQRDTVAAVIVTALHGGSFWYTIRCRAELARRDSRNNRCLHSPAFADNNRNRAYIPFSFVPRNNSNGSLSAYPQYIVRMPYLSPSSYLHLCLFRCTPRFLFKSGALFLLISKF